MILKLCTRLIIDGKIKCKGSHIARISYNKDKNNDNHLRGLSGELPKNGYQPPRRRPTRGARRSQAPRDPLGVANPEGEVQAKLIK